MTMFAFGSSSAFKQAQKLPVGIGQWGEMEAKEIEIT